jgi:putative peptidoglycan lipid II flippase
MSLVLFLTIPAMVGLIIAAGTHRGPVVPAWSLRHQTTRLTSDALLYYALGLWAFSAVRIVVSTFYAMQDTRTPVMMRHHFHCRQHPLGMALMGPMKHCGLALATALSSMVNLALLVLSLRKNWG